jgi:MYXO-CTERM domain-containing protein
MPDWTDHRAGDPGITLVELLAWLGLALLFGLALRARRRRRSRDRHDS